MLIKFGSKKAMEYKDLKDRQKRLMKRLAKAKSFRNIENLKTSLKLTQYAIDRIEGRE